jgi:hypothetical protein
MKPQNISIAVNFELTSDGLTMREDQFFESVIFGPDGTIVCCKIVDRSDTELLDKIARAINHERQDNEEMLSLPSEIRLFLERKDNEEMLSLPSEIRLFLCSIMHVFDAESIRYTWTTGLDINVTIQNADEDILLSGLAFLRSLETVAFPQLATPQNP